MAKYTGMTKRPTEEGRNGLVWWGIEGREVGSRGGMVAWWSLPRGDPASGRTGRPLLTAYFNPTNLPSLANNLDITSKCFI